MAKKKNNRIKVAFLHPDLGMGGAERLVVDAAVGLQAKGCEVTVLTSRHTRDRCFKETVDGTLAVVEYGNWLPRHFFGRFQLVCAWIRNVWLVVCTLLLFGPSAFDIVIVDQIPLMIPVLKLFRLKVLFYCHFPDKLLTSRDSLLKKIYRFPLDKLEELTTGCADCIVVNSEFTGSVFRQSFPSIEGVPAVLHPAVNVDRYSNAAPTGKWPPRLSPLAPRGSQSGPPAPFALSINRFERKKNVELAVHAFATALRAPKLTRSADQFMLVIAGGYDEAVAENVAYLQELQTLVADLGLQDSVLFVPSFSERERSFLLAHARCVLYTPDREHFGIVPLEAMVSQTPVIAVNSGGPRESIVDNECGSLCAPSVDEFSRALVRLLADQRLAKQWGANGRRRVERHFSLAVFSAKLLQIVKDTSANN